MPSRYESRPSSNPGIADRSHRHVQPVLTGAQAARPQVVGRESREPRARERAGRAIPAPSRGDRCESRIPAVSVGTGTTYMAEPGVDKRKLPGTLPPLGDSPIRLSPLQASAYRASPPEWSEAHLAFRSDLGKFLYIRFQLRISEQGQRGAVGVTMRGRQWRTGAGSAWPRPPGPMLGSLVRFRLWGPRLYAPRPTGLARQHPCTSSNLCLLSSLFTSATLHQFQR